MNEMNVILVDEIMGTVVQTDEYFKLINTDPRIKQIEQKLEKIYARIAPAITEDGVEELKEATANLANAYSEISILYGIHVLYALFDLSMRPADLSRHIMTRLSVND